MEDQAFRRERLLASGLLREVSPDEAATLARIMEARATEQRALVRRPEITPRSAAGSHAG